MKIINKIYINGQFISPIGQDVIDIINPSNKEVIGQVTLGNELDTRTAVAAAKAAFTTFSKSSIIERGQILQRLHDAIIAKSDALNAAAVAEYGAPITATAGRTEFAAKIFLLAKSSMEEFEFERIIGKSKVVYEPLGVAALITPWNADYVHIAGKLAPAIATGTTVVIKPSEFSAIQTQVLLECIHAAGVPTGVVNVVNGLGNIVGHELSVHPDIASISFTGSTQVGKVIAKNAVDSMKRVALELGGKSPNILLDDADLDKAIPMALTIGFSNSGQACHAGTRLIVPASRLPEIKEHLVKAVGVLKVGIPSDSAASIGPMVNAKQYETVQRYIGYGIEDGAELLVGGLGAPAGLDGGYFVQPTVFTNVRNDMRIAQEEIFGPVLSVISYEIEEEAVAIANDTVYGLSAYVSSTDLVRANRVASQLVAGRVLINKAAHDEPRAPFGGFKQSGIGRDSGIFAIEEFVEPKALLGYDGR